MKISVFLKGSRHSRPAKRSMPRHLKADSTEPPPYSDNYENCSSQLPEYTCSVLLVAPLLLKCEFDTPFTPSLVRNWERVTAVLRGTKLEFRKKGRRITFGLHAAEVGLALDYRRRSNVIRVRAEGYQFLLATPSLAECLRWIEGISLGVVISDPIEERNDLLPRTVPRRKPHDPSIDTWDDFRRRWREERRRSSKQQRWLRGEPEKMNRSSSGSVLKALLRIMVSRDMKAQLVRPCIPRTEESVKRRQSSMKDEHEQAKLSEGCSVKLELGTKGPAEVNKKEHTGSTMHVDFELDYAKRCAPRILYASKWKARWYYRDGERYVIPQQCDI
ncbi:hypothetical protein AC579_1947 [Pseudocercospora musae]|uniref:PH domain-containing protein n=1 Tax=Pseudocercospora musae TaxID=113226 RepID=A0A139I871_9PEZI|nr:hypothetical protein AC579_1947 [Pseudocercospora musae]